MHRLLLRMAVCTLTPLLCAEPPQLPQNLPEPPKLPEDLRQSAPVAPPDDLPDPSDLTRQLEQLDELLSLDPDELQRLRQTIEFIENMPEAQREAMRIRLRQVTQMTPQLRAEIQELAGLLPKKQHNNLSQFWLAASSDKRKELRQKLDPLSHDKRAETLLKAVQRFVKKRDQAFSKMSDSLQQVPSP